MTGRIEGIVAVEIWTFRIGGNSNPIASFAAFFLGAQKGMASLRDGLSPFCTKPELMRCCA
jgi:hypothetical protein